MTPAPLAHPFGFKPDGRVVTAPIAPGWPVPWPIPDDLADLARWCFYGHSDAPSRLQTAFEDLPDHHRVELAARALWTPCAVCNTRNEDTRP